MIENPKLVNENFDEKIVLNSNIDFEKIFGKKYSLISKFYLFPLYFVYHKKLFFYYVSGNFNLLFSKISFKNIFKRNIDTFFDLTKNLIEMEISENIKKKFELIIKFEKDIRNIIFFERNFLENNIVNFSKVILKLANLERKLFPYNCKYFLKLRKTAKKLDNLEFPQKIKEIFLNLEKDKKLNIFNFQKLLFEYLDINFLKNKKILLNLLNLEYCENINNILLRTFSEKKNLLKLLKSDILFFYSYSKILKIKKEKKIEKTEIVYILKKQLKNLYDINNILQDLKIVLNNEQIIKILITEDFQNYIKNERSFITTKEFLDKINHFLKEKLDKIIYFSYFKLFFCTILIYNIQNFIIPYTINYENFENLGIFILLTHFFMIIFFTSYIFFYLFFKKLFVDLEEKEKIVEIFIKYNLKI